MRAHTKARAAKADALVAEYQRLNDMLRESRITSDNASDEAVVLYERMVQARIERQLILLDMVVV